MINKNIKQNKGQVAVVVLLVSAVLLTLGLSASRKAVTDTKIDTDEELLKEAFNTAESGINNYINVGVTSYDAGDGGKAVISSLKIGGQNSISSEGQVLANNNQLFWLVNHNSNGSIGSTYYDGGSININLDAGFVGALKIDYFYIEGGIYKVKRLICNYGGSTLISNPSPSCSPLSIIGSSLLISAIPLGAPSTITLSGSSNFPLQGEEITSVGTASNGVKTQVKTRNVYQVPSFFLESITAKNIIQ